MLSNAYFLAKFRFDTAENEPSKNLQNFAKFANFANLRTGRTGRGPRLPGAQPEGRLSGRREGRREAEARRAGPGLVRGRGRFRASRRDERLDGHSLSWI